MVNYVELGKKYYNMTACVGGLKLDDHVESLEELLKIRKVNDNYLLNEFDKYTARLKIKSEYMDIDRQKHNEKILNEFQKIKIRFENEIIGLCQFEETSSQMILLKAINTVKNRYNYDEDNFPLFLLLVTEEFKALEDLIYGVHFDEMKAHK